MSVPAMAVAWYVAFSLWVAWRLTVAFMRGQLDDPDLPPDFATFAAGGVLFLLAFVAWPLLIVSHRAAKAARRPSD